MHGFLLYIDVLKVCDADSYLKILNFLGVGCMSVILRNIVKSFNGNVIFKNISAQIHEGDKIGLIGVNGVGKTTLVKILMGEEEFDSGTVQIYPDYMKIGYLKQLNEYEENATVHERLNSFALSASTATNSSSYGRKLKNSLIDLGFKEKDLNKKVSKLSGGEKTRLSLCLVLAENPDILILDEPTNHLDIEAIKWLENFLNSINKTLVIISHDRLFLDNTTNKILVMNSNEIKEYKGNYTDYKHQNEHNIKSLTNKRIK
jgi:ATP-binding cassette subfamily F protein 3